MRYTWIHGVETLSDHVLRTQYFVQAEQILVDLCTGDKHKVLPVLTGAKARLHTWPAGKCTSEEFERFPQEHWLRTDDL